MGFIRLSVVIPCFNGANTLADQLEALAGQSWSAPWEVIISDNGSTDRSRVLMTQYQSVIPNLMVVDSSDRRGPAHARNVGILAATGEAIALCDADDVVAPGWLAAIGEALTKHDFVVCQIEDEKLNAPWARAIWNPSRNGPKPYLGYLPAAAGWGIGFKRSVYEIVGPFNEAFLRLDDIDYSWRVQLAGMNLHFVPEAVVHYRYQHTLTRLYHRAYLDGKEQVLLYKMYAPLGMSWRSWRHGVRAWMRLLKSFPLTVVKASQAKWYVQLGYLMGHLQGSLEHRIWPYKSSSRRKSLIIKMKV